MSIIIKCRPHLQIMHIYKDMLRASVHLICNNREKSQTINNNKQLQGLIPPQKHIFSLRPDVKEGGTLIHNACAASISHPLVQQQDQSNGLPPSCVSILGFAAKSL